jgi:hypothetical protein
MFKKQFSRFAVVAALVTLLGLAAPAISLAAGTGPADALAPTGSWQNLGVGQHRWYAVNTDGKLLNGDPSHVVAILRTSPAICANFNVWTPDQLAQIPSQDPGKPVQPVGRGTQMPYQDGSQTLDRFGGALVWAGAFNESQKFFVQLDQVGAQACDYLLTIAGDTVSFPSNAPAFSNVQPSAPVAPSAKAAALTSSVAGTGPDTAMPITGQWATLPTADHIDWYTFQVSGDTNSEDQPRVLLQLTSQPSGGAKFDVWTADRLHQLSVADRGTTVSPVGAGTPVTAKGDSATDLFGGDLFWLGSTRVAETYFVAVQATGSTPVRYKLSMSTTN